MKLKGFIREEVKRQLAETVKMTFYVRDGETEDGKIKYRKKVIKAQYRFP